MAGEERGAARPTGQPEGNPSRPATPNRAAPARALSPREQVIVDHLKPLQPREPIVQPGAASAPEEFEAALKKNLAAAAFDPQSQQALLEGLRAPDLRERRLWWALVLDLVTGANKKSGDSGVSIRFVQNVPAPQHEDGPLERTTIDVTPARTDG